MGILFQESGLWITSEVSVKHTLISFDLTTEKHFAYWKLSISVYLGTCLPHPSSGVLLTDLPVKKEKCHETIKLNLRRTLAQINEYPCLRCLE